MTQNIPTPETYEAARYAAWRRMRVETLAIRRGSQEPHLQHSLPHVAAYLIGWRNYQAALAVHGSGDRSSAHQVLIAAEHKYVEAIIEDEVAKIVGSADDTDSAK